ncbi:MAG: ABC transporter ATP-binding protein [Gammaproteobacteria bacterium]|nr:ABC transporter ATP-binding protein [Gammaproteobacteria bacterium]
MNESHLLEACDVRFGYSPGVPVVSGVSLAVARGSLCALIGPNGCGKSTLIRLFAGVLQAQAGEIRLDGVPLHGIPRKEAAKRIAYVPQSTAMAFPFTALEVVLTGRSPYTPRFRFENDSDRARALDALDTVGALHLASRPVTELSGGERQMVAVARALAQEPACLLLDEPSAALDLKHRAALVRTLVRLRDTRGLTALVVTHDLHLIDPVFDRVCAIRGGSVIARGSPAEVLRDGVLAEIYDDAHDRTTRVDGRTMIWSE